MFRPISPEPDKPAIGNDGMASLPPSSVKRMARLDVLRGVAISLVLFAHLPFDQPTDWTGYPVLKSLILSGWTGVDLFFVLSGFLISGLLFREYQHSGTIDVKRFLLRRGLKIWPSYYVAFGTLLLVEVAKPCFSSAPPEWHLIPKTWPSWVFLQNYAHNQWGWSWSLAVEEHFYIALPLLLLAVMGFCRGSRAHLRSKVFIAMITVICVVVLCARTRLCFYYSATTWQPMYYPTHLRADSLLFGVLIGYAFHFHRAWLDKLRPRRLAIAVVAALLILPVVFWPIGTNRFVPSAGFTALYLASGAILVITMLTEWSRCPPGYARLFRPALGVLRFLGIYSYTIYIMHFALYALFPETNSLLREYFTLQWALGPYTATLAVCLVYVAQALGSGMLLSHAIERPALAWRERRFAQPQARPCDLQHAIPSQAISVPS